MDDNYILQTEWESEQYEIWAASHECPLCGEPPDYCQGHPDGCPWCLDENADDNVDTDKLCRMHLAEYEGLSLDEMDRRDHEEWMDQQ